MLKKTLCFSFVFLSVFLGTDKIAAVVGNKIILESSIQEQVAAFLSNNNSPFQSQEQIRSQVLDYLIEQEVLVHFAKKDTLLNVSEDEVLSLIGERLDFFTQQLGSVDALEDYFGASFLDIKNTLKVEAESMLLAERMKQKLFSYVSISNTEVKDFYNTYRDSLPLTPKLFNYSCIERVVGPSESSLKETKELAGLVYNKIINNSEVFESFYSKYSGGDLGFFRRGTFIPEFEKVAFSLKEGEVSPPVLSGLGYHIIKLNKRVGEKIDASHILFPLPVTEEDRLDVYAFLNDLQSSSLSEREIDSLSSVYKKDCGGVFVGAPKENIPINIFNSLQKTTPSAFSEILNINANTFALLYLKNIENPRVPDLYDFWGFVEGLALEKKFFSFYNDWYQQNKEKVYIEIR